MNDDAARHLDTFIRISQFGTDNAADFAPGSPGQLEFAVMAGVVDSVQTSGGELASAKGDAGQAFEIKGTKRALLRTKVYDMVDMANAMEYAFDGIADKFRCPRKIKDADLLSTGRAFYEDSLAYNTDFIAYGLPTNFRADLSLACDEFEATFSAAATALADRAEAVAEVTDWVTQGMRSRSILDPIVKQKYKSDPGKLAAWQVATHIEKAPKKKAPTPPTP